MSFYTIVFLTCTCQGWGCFFSGEKRGFRCWKPRDFWKRYGRGGEKEEHKGAGRKTTGWENAFPLFGWKKRLVLFSGNDHNVSVFNSAYLFIEETHLWYWEKHEYRIRANGSFMRDIGKMKSRDSFSAGWHKYMRWWKIQRILGKLDFEEKNEIIFSGVLVILPVAKMKRNSVQFHNFSFCNVVLS